MTLPNESRLLARLAAIGVAALVVCTTITPAVGKPRRQSSSRKNHAALIRVSTAKLRSGPGTQHKAVALLDEGRSARVVARAGEWAKIRLASGRTGWVRRDLIEVSRKATRDPDAPRTTASSGSSRRSRLSGRAAAAKRIAAARKKAPLSTAAARKATPRIAVAPRKPAPTPAPVRTAARPVEKATATEVAEATHAPAPAVDEPLEIAVDNGQDAALALPEDRIERARAALVGEAMSVYDADNEPNRASTGRTALVSRAKSLRGTPYRFGSTGRGSFDCSGFTQHLFRRQGISIPRTAAEQFRAGRSISRDSLRSGDLVFFRNTAGRSGISHVGMYIGDGQFIHASSRGRGVCIDSLSGAYYNNHFAGARRFLK